MRKSQAYWPLILLLAIIKFILPLVLQSHAYELHRDEYLYYQQGQHLALGFLENPPLLAVLAGISSLLGGAEAWIRFWPCLFGAATLVLTCLIAAELGGKLFAQFLAALGIMTGAYMRIHFLFQPNFLDIFFWTLAVYFLIRYINTKELRFIYWLAVALGLGWWGKYSILFMMIAVLMGLLLTRHRIVFLKRQTWLAILLTLVIVLPNAWWQYQHNWPLLHHMNELQSTQLKYLDKSGFLKDQLLMLLPVVIVWLAGLIWVLRHRDYRIVGLIYLSVILLLVVGRGKSYYSLGAYPMLLAAGAVAIERFSSSRLWLRYTVTILVLALGLLLVPVLLPVWEPGKLAAAYKRHDLAKIGILKWEDRQDHDLPQDFADMLGWRELAERSERFYQSLPDSNKINTAIFCRNYGQAGALKYYATDKAFASHVISANGSFLLWIPERMWFRNLILIAQEMPQQDDKIFSHFQSATVIDSVRNSYSRQYGDKVIYFQNADQDCLPLAQQGLRKLKKQFSR